RLLIAHANSGTLEEPAEAATRSRREVAHMLAIRCSFHAADNETTSTGFQCGARLEPSTRCCIAGRIIATFRCRNRSIRLLRHVRLWTLMITEHGVPMSSLHQLNSPGNGHHADPRGCTVGVGREP